MKKVFILFGLMVLTMTFALTRPSKTQEHIVTDEEIEQYKNTILQDNNNVSNEQLNILIDNYVKVNTKTEKTKKGMELGEAFKISFITSSVFCIILFLLFSLKNAQYNEIFGSSFGNSSGNESPLGSLMHFLFGRWF